MADWDIVSSQPANANDPWAVISTDTGQSTAEDMAKTAPSALARGASAIAGLGGDLQGLMSKVDLSPWLEAHTPGADWLKKETEKTVGQGGVAKALATGSADMPGSYKLPTSKDVQGQIEKVTGPLHEPKTAGGRMVNVAGEVLPGLALGGETLPGLIAKSVGSGVASEEAGQAANALKGYLPKTMQPYAEPVARGVGAVAGAFTPAGARRAVTPLPMSDEQFATVNALRNQVPDFPMTAGQATQSPRLMNLEARSPLGQNIGPQQERAFTGAVQQEAGLPAGPYDVTGLDQVGAQLGALRRGNAINSNEFQNLIRLANQERIRMQGVTGATHTQTVRDLINEMRQGAANNPAGVLNMPGQRYEFMRDRIQKLIDAAGSPQEKMALSNIRQGLDNAFYNSVPTDVADRVRQLETNYANAKVLSNVPAKVGRESVTPQEVKGAVASTWGRPAANENRGTLAPLAENASRVMTEHPPIPNEPPAWFDLATSGASGLIHGAAGHALGGGLPGAAAAASEGGVLGHLLAPSIYKVGSRIAGAAASNTPTQAYLANQLWRPGPNTSAERDMILRLLLSPAVNQPSAQ